VSKEYPRDRKQQNHEDQERMSRILKRRADDAAIPSETPIDKSDSSQNPNSKEEKTKV
jgi:hypothetical protein